MGAGIFGGCPQNLMLKTAPGGWGPWWLLMGAGDCPAVLLWRMGAATLVDSEEGKSATEFGSVGDLSRARPSHSRN